MKPAVPKHPAKFSDDILGVIGEHLADNSVVLDPFAGVGRIHELRPRVRTWGIEIEEEWAAASGFTIIGDSTVDIPVITEMVARPEGWDAIATSPTYGNRLADKHVAKDSSDRNTYTHKLGRPLSENNSGGLGWKTEPQRIKYQNLHDTVWAACFKALKPGGRFILNVKDSTPGGVRQRTTAWHIKTLLQLGLDLTCAHTVPTRGMGFGANAKVRIPYESVIVFEKGVA